LIDVIITIFSRGLLTPRGRNTDLPGFGIRTLLTGENLIAPPSIFSDIFCKVFKFILSKVSLFTPFADIPGLLLPLNKQD
jgi:hypothetical protein